VRTALPDASAGEVLGRELLTERLLRRARHAHRPRTESPTYLYEFAAEARSGACAAHALGPGSCSTR
jgi:para-nitrobenzyl esterase